MSCPFIETCPAFSTIMLEEDKSYLAWAFCRTVYADCGRYKATIAGDYVPDGLMPTGEIASPVGVIETLKRDG
jgi:hypothetical protein